MTHRESCRNKTDFKSFPPVSFMIVFWLMFIVQKDDAKRTLSEPPELANTNWPQTRHIRVVFRFFPMIIRRGTTA